MVAMQNLHLAFSLMKATIALLDLCMQHLVLRYIINMKYCLHFNNYKVVVWNSEIIPNKFNMAEFCTSVNYT